MSSAATSPEPASVEEVLRAHLAAHNRQVIWISLLTFVAAVASWLLLRAAIRWLTILFLTVVKGIEAEAPGSIDPIFWPAAAGWVALAWIDGRFRPDARPRDHKSAGEIAWECFLIIPRLTVSVWSNLSARQRLTRPEIAAAAALVERLTDVQKLRLSSMPIELPDDASRFRILYALQLVKVIDIRRQDRELWVALNPLRPAALALAVSQPDRRRASAP